MNLDSFTGPGSTPSRRRFWDKIAAAVNASQKVQGDNVSVEEHDGYGTLINAPSSNRRATATTGACCIDGVCSQLSEDDCATAVGYFFGNGTPCDPDPCPDLGCCVTGEFCETILGSDCIFPSIFIGANKFCWPEGDTSSFGVVSCCSPGDTLCQDEFLNYFCCTPPNTCCNPTSCCTPDQTCCEGFGCCDNDTQECCGEDGCCSIGFCIDGFCTG